MMKPLPFCFLAGLLALFSGCEKTDDSVIDTAGSSPLLLSASVNPSTINTDTVNVGPERKPDDVLQLSVNTYAKVIHPEEPLNIAAVTAIIFGESSSSPIATVILKNDGTGVDSTKNDDVFSNRVTFEIKRSQIGTFTVEVVAEDLRGFKSSTQILPLTIIRANRPPELLNLQVPDTVRLSENRETLLLRVTVADPDGATDIRQVIFNSFLPDGRPSSGNPFRMYDDGTNGDFSSGDGIYSLLVASPTNVGQYRFEYQAFDRSNAGSNIIVHTITVVP